VSGGAIETPAAGVDAWLDQVAWDERGLVPAIAQEAFTNRVLMFAWMNRESLKLTFETGQAVYWSRSRQRLWHKGEESGHFQKVRELRVDCDADVILMKVDQVGGIACHTGRHNCFFRKLDDGAWVETDPVVRSAQEIYAK
jgi:phosphoribosyl-AMP cyclohydrolase